MMLLREQTKAFRVSYGTMWREIWRSYKTRRPRGFLYLDCPNPKYGPYYIALLTLLWTTLFYHLFTHYVADSIRIIGTSMEPNYNDGEHLVMHRWPYYFREPERGDVIVVEDAGNRDYAIKRIVVMPQEAVRITAGHVLVNGRVIAEPYLSSDTRTFASKLDGHTFQLPVDHYFILGDNRPMSVDSRSYGGIHGDKIVGVVMQ